MDKKAKPQRYCRISKCPVYYFQKQQLPDSISLIFLSIMKSFTEELIFQQYPRRLLFSQLIISNSATPWTAACQASLSFTVSWSLLQLMFIELMIPSNHLILCHPLLLLASVFPSVFSNELALCIRWPKYWGFSFSISPFNQYSGLISF